MRDATGSGVKVGVRLGISVLVGKGVGVAVGAEVGVDVPVGVVVGGGAVAGCTARLAVGFGEGPPPQPALRNRTTITAQVMVLPDRPVFALCI